MAAATSPVTGQAYGVKRVCAIWASRDPRSMMRGASRDGHGRALPADAVRNRGTATRICSLPFATTWRARRGPARGTARSGRGSTLRIPVTLSSVFRRGSSDNDTKGTVFRRLDCWKLGRLPMSKKPPALTISSSASRKEKSKVPHRPLVKATHSSIGCVCPLATTNSPAQKYSIPEPIELESTSSTTYASKCFTASKRKPSTSSCFLSQTIHARA
jgi:hypothetical protein